jgi:hypothetical protein
MLAAEAAILRQFDAIGSILLILEGVVVALLALGAGKGNLGSHGYRLLMIVGRWI